MQTSRILASAKKALQKQCVKCVDYSALAKSEKLSYLTENYKPTCEEYASKEPKKVAFSKLSKSTQQDYLKKAVVSGDMETAQKYFTAPETTMVDIIPMVKFDRLSDEQKIDILTTENGILLDTKVRFEKPLIGENLRTLLEIVHLMSDSDFEEFIK